MTGEPDDDDSGNPHCPLCDEECYEYAWEAVRIGVCNNDECPIEEWDPEIHWVDE